MSRTSPSDPDEQEPTPGQAEASPSEAPAGDAAAPEPPATDVGRRAAWILRAFVLPVLIGLGGAWIGMLVAGRQTVVLGPFQVQLEANFGRGDTVIALPPSAR